MSEKKDVGILTLYDAFNYGAFLQAYAMQEILRKEGYSPYFIKDNGESKNTVKKLFKQRKSYWMAYGLRTFLKLKQAWTLLNIDHDPHRRYDAVIVGSDEMWSVKNDQYAHIPGHFSLGLDTGKTIAYAPSCGSSKTSDLESSEMACKGLQEFTYISARDRNTQSIVHKLTGRVPQLVADPTLVYDFSRELNPVERGEYLFVYLLAPKPDQIAQIRGYASEHNLKIISGGIGNFHFWVDKYSVVDPLEMLNLMNDAAAIVTNTFHGTILSMKLNKPFASFSDKRPKVQMILSQYGLTSRDASLFSLKDILASAIEYSRVNDLIKDQKTASLEYLRSALND